MMIKVQQKNFLKGEIEEKELILIVNVRYVTYKSVFNGIVDVANDTDPTKGNERNCGASVFVLPRRPSSS